MFIVLKMIPHWYASSAPLTCLIIAGYTSFHVYVGSVKFLLLLTAHKDDFYFILAEVFMNIVH
jgi:hypothetical protein